MKLTRICGVGKFYKAKKRKKLLFKLLATKTHQLRTLCERFWHFLNFFVKRLFIWKKFKKYAYKIIALWYLPIVIQNWRKFRHIKVTLMQISKSANIFAFTWKQYAEDFTLKHLLRFWDTRTWDMWKVCYKDAQKIE